MGRVLPSRNVKTCQIKGKKKKIVTVRLKPKQRGTTKCSNVTLQKTSKSPKKAKEPHYAEWNYRLAEMPASRQKERAGGPRDGNIMVEKLDMGSIRRKKNTPCAYDKKSAATMGSHLRKGLRGFPPGNGSLLRCQENKVRF